MHIVIVRHAIAEDRVAFARTGRPDAERPLTPRDIKRMRKAARGLRRLVPEIGLLAVSPLRRGAETAAIVCRAYGNIDPMTTELLDPAAAPSAVVDWLRTLRRDPVVLVGHEPQLSRLASRLVTGRDTPILVLDKGGACSIDVAPRATGGGGGGGARGTLDWLLTSKQLRAIARRRSKAA